MKYLCTITSLIAFFLLGNFIYHRTPFTRYVETVETCMINSGKDCFGWKYGLETKDIAKLKDKVWRRDKSSLICNEITETLSGETARLEAIKLVESYDNDSPMLGWYKEKLIYPPDFEKTLGYACYIRSKEVYYK